MKTIFIATQVDDEHALGVDFILSRRGHKVLRWFGADFPHTQAISIGINNALGASTYFNGQDFEVQPGNLDSVWYRRPCAPILKPELVHPEDRAAAKLENDEFFRSLVHLVGEKAVWVNSVASSRYAECKLVQLREAVAVGLHIPDTISTNDPDRVRAFMKQNAPQQTIYKPFFPARWFGEDKYAIAATAVLNQASMPQDGAIKLAAGIYQQRVEKAYEVRATFFGDCSRIKTHANSHCTPNGNDSFCGSHCLFN